MIDIVITIPNCFYYLSHYILNNHYMHCR
eukprot:UN06984